ncbi:DNA repair protein RecN, partial [Vibrio parahaemolyticus]|nr:DNA repair protein RecN [Vibrio parahaemolyticus]
FSGHLNLLKTTRSEYHHLSHADNNLTLLNENSQQNQAQKQLLEYKIKELNEQSLGEEEFAELEQEHKRLSNSGELAATCQ